MIEAPLTISVPEAGEKYFGIGKNAAYRAAERGEIPTIKVGRLLRVPVAALEKMMESAVAKAAAHMAGRDKAAAGCSQ